MTPAELREAVALALRDCPRHQWAETAIRLVIDECARVCEERMKGVDVIHQAGGGVYEVPWSRPKDGYECAAAILALLPPDTATTTQPEGTTI